MPEPRKAESNKYNTIGNDIKTGEGSREGPGASRKVSAAPSPPASAPACNVLNVVDTLHDVWHDVCADSGATEDVLNSRCGVEANNIKQVDDIILMGMGGEVVIDQVGDYKFKNELKSEGALINNSCNMSCLSVPSRCSQGPSGPKIIKLNLYHQLIMNMILHCMKVSINLIKISMQKILMLNI